MGERGEGVRFILLSFRDGIGGSAELRWRKGGGQASLVSGCVCCSRQRGTGGEPVLRQLDATQEGQGTYAAALSACPTSMALHSCAFVLLVRRERRGQRSLLVDAGGARRTRGEVLLMGCSSREKRAGSWRAAADHSESVE